MTMRAPLSLRPAAFWASRSRATMPPYVRVHPGSPRTGRPRAGLHGLDPPHTGSLRTGSRQTGWGGPSGSYAATHSRPHALLEQDEMFPVRHRCPLLKTGHEARSFRLAIIGPDRMCPRLTALPWRNAASCQWMISRQVWFPARSRTQVRSVTATADASCCR